MSTGSFPLLDLAKKYGLSYTTTLRFSDFVEKLHKKILAEMHEVEAHAEVANKLGVEVYDKLRTELHELNLKLPRNSG